MLIRCSVCNKVFPDFVKSCPECKLAFQKSSDATKKKVPSKKELVADQSEYEKLVLDFVYDDK